MSDDVIDVGLSVGPVTISVNSLLRKLFGRKDRGPTEIVAERFLSLFGAHGVAVSQIPRLLPTIGLDKLNSKEALLGVLTDKLLNRTVKLFGVQREWLDGTIEEIYPCRSCYKHPKRFFEDLSELRYDESPVRALYATKRLSARDGCPQPVALLLAERVAEFGDEEILRFRIYWDTWDWGYAPSRIQLKALVRLAYQILDRPVPLYRVGSKVLAAVRAGRMVPRCCLKGSILTEPSLEDFALSPEQSGQAKEVEELPSVFEYIEAKGLHTIARKVGKRKMGVTL